MPNQIPKSLIMFHSLHKTTKWLPILFGIFLFVCAGSICSDAATFYSRPSATNFADAASWSVNANGIGGSGPESVSNADDFVIQNGADMVLNASAAVRKLTLNSGRLTVATNTLTISIATGNNSTLLLSGDAQFNQTGGSVLLNGNMDIVAGASFFQTGGTFTVDGNDNGAATTSVPGGIAIVRWAINSPLRLVLNGGTFTIVDPHAGTEEDSDWTFNYNSTVTVASGTGHTFQIGDGVSTQAGGNAGGFIVEGYQDSGRLLFGNLTINTLTSEGNRHISNGTSFSGQIIAVLGNFTIHPGSEYRAYSYGTVNGPNNLAVGGNLSNNGTLVMPGTLLISSSSGITSPQPSTLAQNIGGSGTYQNGHPTFAAAFQASDANYCGLTVNNSSEAGVTFNAKAINSAAYKGTVKGTLTFTRGQVNASAAPFFLGTNVATRGTLNWTAGGFTSGTTFGRWYPNAPEGATFTLSSDLTSPAGRYPFASGTLDKSFFVRVNTAPDTGGTISVLFTDAISNSAVNFADGSYTIRSRHDASWTVSNSGFSGNPMIYLGARLPGSFLSNNGNVRLCLAQAPAPGSNQQGIFLPAAQRIDIPFDILAGTYYMGVNTSDQPFESISSGNYNDPGIWNKGSVPAASDVVSIGAGTTVIIDDVRTNNGTSISQGGTLTMATGANFTVTGPVANLVVNGIFNGNAGKASIGGNLNKGVLLGPGGVFNVAGATINVGPTDNSVCNRLLIHSGGTLNVSSGTLFIAGRYLSSPTNNPKFIQTGGVIKVDGNAGGSTANSTAGLIFDLQVASNSDVQLSGGSITIVDPSANATSASAFNYICAEPGETPTTTGHKFYFGDGISSDAGSSIGYQFRVVPRASVGFFKFCNLVVRTGSGTNRAVTLGTGLGMYQNLTINAGSTWNAGSGQQIITGNFIVNGTAIMQGAFQNCSVLHNTSSFGPTNIATTIGGTGTIQNLASNSNAQFTDIYMDNTAGITLNRPITMSGALTLVRGQLTTSESNDLTHISSIGTGDNIFFGPTTAGYINGPFRRVIPQGLVFSNNTMTFPLGKSGPNWLKMNLTTLNAKTSLKAEVFDSNSGTAGSGLSSLNTGRRWQLDVEGTNNISVFNLSCYDNNMASGNLLARSSSAAGSYSAFGESNSFTSAGAIFPASLSTVNPDSGISLPFSIGYGEKQQAPTASFTFSPQTITTCDQVNFSNTSTNATSYQWTFGDPESGSLDTSILANPVYLYPAEGVYSVRLIAVSSAGKDTADALVTVNTCTITGMKNEKNNPLIIHPNPFENQFRIINQDSFGHFILSDLYGKIHWQGNQPEKQDFSFLPSGNYLLKATEFRNATFKLMKK